MKAIARRVGRLDHGVSPSQSPPLGGTNDAEPEAHIEAQLKEIEPALVDQWEGRPSD